MQVHVPGYEPSRDNARIILIDNLDLLEEQRKSGACPALFAFLDNGRSRIGDKLIKLHEYLLDVSEQGYGTYCRYHKVYECFASLGSLRVYYGGGKDVWKKTLLKLAYLGLLYIHVPTDKPEINTEQHMKSLARMKPGYKHPVTWYGVPKYTTELLLSADALSAAAGQIKGKDSLRDLIGEHRANLISSTGYNIHRETAERRALLLDVLQRTIERKGFAYDAEIVEIARAKRREEGDGWRMEATWNEYRNTALKTLNLTRGRPTQTEKDKYGLTTCRYIIRDSQ